MSKFLSKPNLGRQLTIANGCLWVLYYFLSRYTHIPGPFLFSLYVVISIPFAFFCMLPHVGGGPSEIEVVISALVIGLNSIVWGYSFAWIGNRLEPRDVESGPEKRAVANGDANNDDSSTNESA